VSDPVSNVAVLVLAAGLGSRFDANESKLAARLHERPLIRHVVEVALASRANKTIVVTGHRPERVEAALAGLDVTFAYNPDYASGIASSLRTGLARAGDCAGVLVLLGDMPCVAAETLDLLIEAFENAASGCIAVAPNHEGRRGNPVLLSQDLFPRLMQLSGDEGAGRLLRSVTGVLDLPVMDRGVILDIDTPADIEALRAEQN
jgi:molybdenum cofactor cytidylyltransferase